MIYTSELDSSGQLTNDPSVSNAATGAIPPSARTTAVSRTLPSRSPAIDEIASDSAKVSLAGVMLSQATQGSDVRFDKVAALRQSIDADTYAVPTANLASKLIDSMQQ